MTKEQEKARELIEYFDELLTYVESKQKVKQCALKVCDEVLGDMGSDRGYDSWVGVKQAIKDYKITQ